MSNITQLQDQCDESMLGPKRDPLYVVVPVITVYVVIFVAGIIGNVSTCIVIARNKSMHTATNYYLFSLAVSDLLLLLAGVPPEIYSIWSRYPYIFGATFCFLRGLFSEISSNATVLTITAFTVERYLAICHPFLSHTMSKLSRAVKLIIAIWLLSICLAVPQAMPLRIISIGGCLQCMVVDTVIEHAFEISTFLFFVAPMTMITVLYVLIGTRLKSSRMMKRRISTNARVQSKSSRKVVKMLVAVVVAFFICWAPFHIQRLYSIYSMPGPDSTAGSHDFYLKIYALVTYVSGILYYVSATINPILYNIMSAKFRDAFKETFARCCCFGHLHHGRPQRSYSVLSKSNFRGPESTDSGSHDPTGQTNTTNASLTNKNSLDSFNGNQIYSGRRFKTSNTTREAKHAKEEEKQRQSNLPGVEMQTLSTLSNPNNAGLLTVRVGSPASPTRLAKFFEFFHCIAKKTLDDGRRFPSYYSSPAKEADVSETEKPDGCATDDDGMSKGNFHNPCISNSSLKDVETGAIEDELTAYMNEIKRREMCS